MGQRHQFFAIARINNRYRTLAVIHNQWLYGHSAVRQCLNTMRILSAAGNLQGIRRELKLAESKPDSFWEAKPRARGDDKGRVCSFLAFIRELSARCASVHVQAHAPTLASGPLSMPELFELCVVAARNTDYKFLEVGSQNKTHLRPSAYQSLADSQTRALTFHLQRCVCRLDVASQQTSMNPHGSLSSTLMPNTTLYTTTMAFRFSI